MSPAVNPCDASSVATASVAFEIEVMFLDVPNVAPIANWRP
jgi:hypothetical protein